MRKNPAILYKTLVVGVIVLSIGVGIQPAVAVTTDTSESDDDCNLCPDSDNKYLVRLQSLLDKIENYDNQLSKISNIYPEIEMKYPELSERITNLKEMNNELKQMTNNDNSILCAVVLSILIGTSGGMAIFIKIVETFGRGSLVWILLSPLLLVLLMITATSFALYNGFNCWPIP